MERSRARKQSRSVRFGWPFEKSTTGFRLPYVPDARVILGVYDVCSCRKSIIHGGGRLYETGSMHTDMNVFMMLADDFFWGRMVLCPRFSGTARDPAESLVMQQEAGSMRPEHRLASPTEGNSGSRVHP